MRLALCVITASMLMGCQTTANNAEPLEAVTPAPVALEDITCPPKNRDGNYDFEGYSDLELMHVMEHGCKKAE